MGINDVGSFVCLSHNSPILDQWEISGLFGKSVFDYFKFEWKK